ncbi:576_t:CDS:2 [Funneliformis mosseae]|uniref:576_t:CDS:1 n=1 Tax=Funneliformis mosseae TaxID=27381 RepID=A0A9N9G4P6_FUNMO|nr:576_t:CDS:2 [Funneliformis mosseae]
MDVYKQELYLIFMNGKPNWTKNGIYMPQPQISSHTMLTSSWEIPMPHSLSVVRQLKGKQLQEELENRGTIVDERENRDEMIRTLEYEMAKETQSKKIGGTSEKTLSNNTNTSQTSNSIDISMFPLLCGWALKHRRMNGYTMREKLVEKQESGELAQDVEIPEVPSINNWITRFAAKSKKNLSEQAIASSLTV